MNNIEYIEMVEEDDDSSPGGRCCRLNIWLRRSFRQRVSDRLHRFAELTRYGSQQAYRFIGMRPRKIVDAINGFLGR